MLSDVDCPYCGKGQDICHDDGFGYEEGELHQQSCVNCDKDFGFYTSISFDYEAQKVECFNGVECEWKETQRTVVEGAYDITHFRCVYCDRSKMVRNDVKKTHQSWR
jgi:hypothetical protein